MRIAECGLMAGWTGSTEDLAEVLRFAADGITVQGADGRLVYANDSAARQAGFTSGEELLATPIAEVLRRYEIIDESGAPLPLDALPGRRALRGELEPAAVVGFRIDRRADVRWSIVEATPVMREGAVAFVINVFHDITAMKLTEERLRLLADAGEVLAESTDYPATLQALAELVVPGLADWCVVDVVEESGLRRVAVSHADPDRRALAEAMQDRYPPDPDRPGGVSEVIRTGEPAIVPEISDEMLVAAARDDEHLRLIRSLGLRSVAILPLTARGQTLGALTLARAESDERYELDDRPFLADLARRAAVAVDNSRLLHEATESLRLRDEFLAMASHDMRTPLGAILANIQLARRRLVRVGGEAEDVERNLENAERTTGRLAGLIGELMDISLLRAGHPLPLQAIEVDLVELAHRVVDEHGQTTDDHDFTFRGEPSVIGRWDPGRVERVIDNLVDNAVKYSPNGGEITIDVTTREGDAVLSVSDRGIGVPADQLERIFEPYGRGSNAGSLRGIGLGLTGARQVVRRLGGDLSARNAEGGGTTFTLRLPIGESYQDRGVKKDEAEERAARTVSKQRRDAGEPNAQEEK